MICDTCERFVNDGEAELDALREELAGHLELNSKLIAEAEERHAENERLREALGEATSLLRVAQRCGFGNGFNWAAARDDYIARAALEPSLPERNE